MIQSSSRTYSRIAAEALHGDSSQAILPAN